MPRSIRLEFPGAFYHVMARGNRREVIYTDDEDRRFFLHTLGQTCERTGWRVHAWTLMSNHYHLFIETPEANLVSGMTWLQNTAGKGVRVQNLTDCAGSKRGAKRDFFESNHSLRSNTSRRWLYSKAAPQTQSNTSNMIMKSLFKSIACILSLAALSAGPLQAQVNLSPSMDVDIGGGAILRVERAIVSGESAHTKDIVDTAVAAGSFKTLAAALTAAGLVDTLGKGSGFKT